MKLYEITNRYQQILDWIDSLDPVSDKEEIDGLYVELETLDDNAEDKAVYHAQNIKNLESEYEAVEKAIKAMQERKKSLESKIEGKRSHLKFHMEKIGLKVVNKSPNFVIQLQKSRELLDVVDEKIVPPEYIRSKMIQSIDRITALKEIQEGVVIPGLSTKREIYLVIK